jgi:excisionase family DNA binding protein
MLLLCEGPLFIAGLVVLIVGSIDLGGTRKLRGKQARIFGLTLMLTGIGPLFGFVFGFASVWVNIPLSAILATAAIFEILILIGALIAAAIMIFNAPASPTESQVSLPAAPTLPPVLTLEEAANYLRVSEEAILSLIEKGDLLARQLDGQYRLDRERSSTC